MFNFFREVYWEYRGCDVEAERDKYEFKRKKREKLTVNIFSAVILALLAAINIFSAVMNFQNGNMLFYNIYNIWTFECFNGLFLFLQEKVFLDFNG
jgi:hypothetical protein